MLITDPADFPGPEHEYFHAFLAWYCTGWSRTWCRPVARAAEHLAQLQRDVRGEPHVGILEVVAEDLGRHAQPVPESVAVHVAPVRGLLMERVVEGRLEHGQKVAVVLASQEIRLPICSSTNVRDSWRPAASISSRSSAYWRALSTGTARREVRAAKAPRAPPVDRRPRTADPQVGVARTAAGLRLQMHQRDPDFKRYVDRELPWPDELEEGFVPRCTCHDRCLFHDVGRRGTLEDDCSCDKACGQHGEPPEAEAA